MTVQPPTLVEDLTLLNQIADTLNRSVDVKSALQSSLEQLIDLMGMHTGWIFVRDPHDQGRWHGKGYRLVAHHHLPPALNLESELAWAGGCDCQGLCNKGKLTEAYNEVQCSRLKEVQDGDKEGLAVHASVPLRSGDEVLGIINIAAPNWSAFDARALALLTNVGNMMGVALERARLYDLLNERRVLELSSLLEFSNQLLSRRDLNTLMHDLVEEARRSLKVDASALILPDDKGDLYFRAVSGWREDPVSLQHYLPKYADSGPRRVMQSQEPLIIEDLEEAAGRAQAPLMADWLRVEEFRGHAVVPLIVEGHSIGVLVVDSRQPRRYNEDEVRFLRLLANQAALALETARLQEEDLKLHRMNRELAISQEIQLSMLPEECPMWEGWQFAAKYKAARIVGGDFYDFFQLPKETHKIGMIVADVADKGIPAALFMALSRTIIRNIAMTGRTPASVLTRANEIIQNDNRSNVFLTACYAILNTENSELTFTNAGHNPLLWYSAKEDRIHRLRLPGIVVGIFPEVRLHEKTIQLEKDDFLVFYTDGVTEARSEEGKEFGEAHLLRIIYENRARPAEEILNAVVDAIRDFMGDAVLFDDFTLFVVKRDQPPSSDSAVSIDLM